MDMLDRIQSQTARFIIKDYRSGRSGLIGQMLKKLSYLPPTSSRQLRLTILFTVVVGLVPELLSLELS